ncbi:ABC transporter ATP-binding protein [Pelolinea submarina]|uniref:Iron complex transport system ATP-binding protein n=1 Tax=Pelolinea submarina TaxID=913107 RepID=A0A347ZR71_9CHLR|nr:ABC transporter ATP-binding protein [Pelolinea submarina]REG11644.1 iron complex transport system ATP-binding protein [Pelolinea submarina]BBB47802.1 iron complex transport system ATP-binding protein [Pelolinea submarina]
MNILRAEELSLGYRNKKVVEQFSTSIQQGSLIGMVGPNGSGKTTLLRALSGLIKPFGGQVFVGEQNLFLLTPRKRAQLIGWVPQRERLAWPLTVREVISLGRAPHRGWLLPMTKTDQAVIDDVIHNSDLDSLEDRRMDELSGGEFQRVLIARALTQEPRVLLLDEPTTNLDIHYQIQVMDLIRQLVSCGGITVLMVIHDLNIAARYCDGLILLHRGKQICAGSPVDVLTPENLEAVFNVKTNLYRDPWGFWAVSARNGTGQYGREEPK